MSLACAHDFVCYEVQYSMYRDYLKYIYKIILIMPINISALILRNHAPLTQLFYNPTVQQFVDLWVIKLFLSTLLYLPPILY